MYDRSIPSPGLCTTFLALLTLLLAATAVSCSRPNLSGSAATDTGGGAGSLIDCGPGSTGSTRDTPTVNAAAASAGIVSSYPGDVGIETHPDVVFVERFDDWLSHIFSRWGDVRNGANMTLDADVPAGSPGGCSLQIAGANGGGYLYKLLAPAHDDTLSVRYYVKYPRNSSPAHTGIWVGGSSPPLFWPNPQAGIKPTGHDRFIAGAEATVSDGHQFDHYDYWMGMHRSADGQYWGNVLLNNPKVRTKLGEWLCVEHMVKLNNPVTSANGEHAIWLDGRQVSHLGPGFPQGFWLGGRFMQDASVSTTFEGFQWRNDPALKLNWIWLQNYTPTDASMTLKFAHVVVAMSYIGCLSGGPRE